MKIFLFGLSIFCFLLYLFPLSPVFAARNLSITSNKTSLFGEEEMALTASISGFTNGETIYIKGAFYQEGTTSYFGYTKNSDTWIKNGDTTTKQRLIKIGEWDGNVTAKSDYLDSGYKGEGEYKFKIGFYYTTSGGNLSSVNWSSNILAVNLDEPDPTPTNTPIPTNTSQPTSTPKPSSSPSPVPTTTKIATPTKIPISPKVYGESNILGVVKVSKDTTPTSPDIKGIGQKEKSDNLAKLLIGLGGIMILGAAVWIGLIIRKEKQSNIHP